MGFCHLHSHTNYSTLDGLQSIEQMVAWAKKNQHKYLAITDHGWLVGVPSFINACEKENIKPIIGCELYYTSRYAGSRELGADERKHQYHLTVIAKNNEGYKNLLRLSSYAHTRGFYYNPCIDFDMLRTHSEGLIVLSGCMSAYVPQLIIEDKYELALEQAKIFRELFKDDYYIELMKHPVTKYSEIEEIRVEQEKFEACQDKLLKGLYQLSDELSIPTVATNDAHYNLKEEHDLHDVVLCMGTGRKVNDVKRLRFPTDQFYMKTEEEMLELFPAEAVHRTVEIAEKCDVRLDEIYDGNFRMPHFPKVPAGMTEAEYLRKLAFEGLEARGLADLPKYIERLNHELDVIIRLGWPGYFLILWDVMKFCAENNIRRGPARGSAGGSLVSYVLDITKIDPLKYDLLFERFLNESRVSPPDIDCDFPKKDRQRVIDYVVNLYGVDNVVQIGTVNLMATKGAIKKACTAFEVPFDKANLITSYVTDDVKSVEDALRVPHIKKMYDTDPLVRRALDVAIRVENMPSHVGIHAAGVVISPTPVVEHIPVRSAEGTIVTQWPMEVVEAYGGLKMDFLGVATLDVIDYAIEEVKRNRGDIIDINNIDLESKPIYDVLSKADTSGVFQLESTLSRGYLKKMRPNRFNHIIDFVALIRPGPLKAPSPSGRGTMVDEYIARLHGQSPIVYPHPLLKDTLESTYAVFNFQEQVMSATRIMAGFSAIDADRFRKVVGSKIEDEMPHQIEKFIQGCIANGIKKDDAEKVSKLLETFASYGFNKCLAGDTKIWIDLGGGHGTVTIEELYNYLTTSKLLSQPVPEIKLLSSVDGIVKPTKLINVYKTGRKRLYIIKTEKHKEIRATNLHKFLTNRGWKRLKEIDVGDYIYVTDLNSTTLNKDGFHVTYLDKIVSITKGRIEQTYDIEMEAPHHNFLANGIVTHNSHAVAYGVLTAQTAYLKALYPVEFMASLITHEEEPDKVRMYLAEAFDKGIKLLPPSVNISTDKFVADGDNIRYALNVKGVGAAAVAAIRNKIEEGGPFTCFEDFLLRAYGGAVNKTVIESLARAGALDGFKLTPEGFTLTRKQMAESVESVTKAFNSYKSKIKRIEDKYELMLGWDDVSKVEKERKKLEERRSKAYNDLLTTIREKITQIEGEYTSEELSQFELELLGYYVMHHPLNEYRGHYNALRFTEPPLVASSDLKKHANQTVRVFGMVSEAKSGKARYGPMLDLSLQDWGGSISAKAYGKQATSFVDLLKAGSVVIITGKVIHYESSDYYHIRVDKVEPAIKGLPLQTVFVFADHKKINELVGKIENIHQEDIIPGRESSVTIITDRTYQVLTREIPDYRQDDIMELDGVYQVLVL